MCGRGMSGVRHALTLLALILAALAVALTVMPTVAESSDARVVRLVICDTAGFPLTDDPHLKVEASSGTARITGDYVVIYAEAFPVEVRVFYYGVQVYSGVFEHPGTYHVEAAVSPVIIKADYRATVYLQCLEGDYAKVLLGSGEYQISRMPHGLYEVQVHRGLRVIKTRICFHGQRVIDLTQINASIRISPRAALMLLILVMVPSSAVCAYALAQGRRGSRRLAPRLPIGGSSSASHPIPAKPRVPKKAETLRDVLTRLRY